MLPPNRSRMLQEVSDTFAVLSVACLILSVCGCRGPVTPIEQCRDELDAGRYGNAIPLLKAEILKAPADAELIQWLGLAYWENGQTDKAAEHFGMAQHLLPPTDPSASEYLGYVEMRRRHWGYAEAALARSLRTSRSNPRAWTALAVVQLGTNNTSSAQTYLKEALRLDPNYPPALYNLAWLNYYCRQPNLEEAERLYKRYLAVSDDRVRIARTKAVLSKIAESASPARTLPRTVSPRNASTRATTRR